MNGVSLGQIKSPLSLCIRPHWQGGALQVQLRDVSFEGFRFTNTALEKEFVNFSESECYFIPEHHMWNFAVFTEERMLEMLKD